MIDFIILFFVTLLISLYYFHLLKGITLTAGMNGILGLVKGHSAGGIPGAAAGAFCGYLGMLK